MAEEIVRGRALGRVHLALDFFDASMNRVGALVLGARATLKAFLLALLQPLDRLTELEAGGNHFGRLALLEESKALPSGAVWDYYCLTADVPPAEGWIREIEAYEKAMLSKREAARK